MLMLLLSLAMKNAYVKSYLNVGNSWRIEIANAVEYNKCGTYKSLPKASSFLSAVDN